MFCLHSDNDLGSTGFWCNLSKYLLSQNSASSGERTGWHSAHLGQLQHRQQQPLYPFLNNLSGIILCVQSYPLIFHNVLFSFWFVLKCLGLINSKLIDHLKTITSTNHISRKSVHQGELFKLLRERVCRSPTLLRNSCLLGVYSWSACTCIK